MNKTRLFQNLEKMGWELWPKYNPKNLHIVTVRKTINKKHWLFAFCPNEQPTLAEKNSDDVMYSDDLHLYRAKYDQILSVAKALDEQKPIELVEIFPKYDVDQCQN